MARELRWPGAHPMHLDISLDQLAFLRPTRALGGHTTPVRGLVISVPAPLPSAESPGHPAEPLPWHC